MTSRYYKPGELSRDQAESLVWVYMVSFEIDEMFDNLGLQVRTETGRIKCTPTRSDKETALIEYLCGGKYWYKNEESGKVLKHEEE